MSEYYQQLYGRAVEPASFTVEHEPRLSRPWYVSCSCHQFSVNADADEIGAAISIHWDVAHAAAETTHKHRFMPANENYVPWFACDCGEVRHNRGCYDDEGKLECCCGLEDMDRLSERTD